MNHRLLFPIIVFALAACAPALDWRELRLDGAGAAALFPCKPAREARTLALDGQRVEMAVHACSADGATWGVAHADVGDPARVAPALAALGAAAARNVGSDPVAGAALDVRGMTPNPLAQRLRLDGRRPDGSPIVLQVALFAKGTRVFQATVAGGRPDAAEVQTFFDGLKFAS